jgi:hypothetical protein
MKSKNLIIMIIVVLSFFCGQLNAEEVVGESIYFDIETPHPYSKVSGDNIDNIPVWTETIHMPGAAWLKIHFSEFSLDSDDYVDLVDMNGRLIERIRGRDVSNSRLSRFKVRKNSIKTVNFWAPAVEGDRLLIELYQKCNKGSGWGFVINEIGIGSKPIFDIGLGPVYDSGEGCRDNSYQYPCPDRFWENSPKAGQNVIRVFSSISGFMLFRKSSTWFSSRGFLENDNSNQFVPEEFCIDAPEIADTLEVRFYSCYDVHGIKTIMYSSYFCDEMTEVTYDFITNTYDILSLKHFSRTIYIPNNGIPTQFYRDDHLSHTSDDRTCVFNCYGTNYPITVTSGCEVFQCYGADSSQNYVTCCCAD